MVSRWFPVGFPWFPVGLPWVSRCWHAPRPILLGTAEAGTHFGPRLGAWYPRQAHLHRHPRVEIGRMVSLGLRFMDCCSELSGIAADSPVCEEKMGREETFPRSAIQIRQIGHHTGESPGPHSMSSVTFDGPKN